MSRQEERTACFAIRDACWPYVRVCRRQSERGREIERERARRSGRERDSARGGAGERERERERGTAQESAGESRKAVYLM